ncbi:uncharacterized protein LOC115879029 [Sitophilus oryzae]|uniref:Uncharacterized protein LOC115879029 n=1 Tax=Sitophilus oryzae TaxID=7048 RepID=A0A6J2XJ66_SITOR|nr:uncharacterized protein LOC115879029 [Sitophilus oryzae]
MIALKDLPIMQILLIFLIDLVTSYPSNIYGTKRYGRYRSTVDPIDPYETTYVRTQRYPYTYYPNYAQAYPDDYYYTPDAYPIYYIYPRTSNYDLYQAGLPYYYQEMQPARSKYDYYNYVDPTINDQERIVQDMEREQRERSQPIGHEIRYENDYNLEGDSNVDETNAAFLNNLMMQQMFQGTDKPSKEKGPYYDQYPYDYAVDETSDVITIPSKWDDVPYDRPVNVEDEDVKELKELPKKQKQRKNRDRKQRRQRVKPNNGLVKRSQDDVVVYTDRKPVIKDVLITEPPVPSTEGPRRDVRGQKEEVLMRPATPVRHPFSESVLGMINQQEERKRSPSVYDTIRKMLEMEKKYEDEHPDEELQEPMKKRIVSSEDSLTRQLSVLKKAQ